MKKGILAIFIFCLLLLCGCEEKDLIESDQYQYYYEKLDEQEKEAYKKVYTAVVLREESVSLKKIDADALEKIYISVRNDHPELFWMDNAYSYTSKFGGATLELILSYPMKETQIENAQKAIDAQWETFFQGISKEDTAYQKMKKAYTYIIQNTKYVSEAKNDQNIQSVFIEKESVCAGYARAFQYLLTKMGMNCTYIEGESTTKDGITLRHAWNMVFVEDDYYYVDPTWGDVEEGISHACDAYFMMHSEEMLSCYKPSSVYEHTKQEESQWYETKENYVKEWNEQQIRTLWKKANEKSQHFIEIKCSEEAYDGIVDRMKKGEMYEIMRQMGMYPSTLYYVKHDALHTMEIFY